MQRRGVAQEIFGRIGVGVEQPRGVVHQPRLVVEVFEQVVSYLLELDHLKLDLESMFLDKENRPVLCYLPEYEKRV